MAQAATATLGTEGYKMSAVMTVSGGGTPVSATMSGSVDASGNSGSMTIDEVIGGKRVRVPMIFSQLNFWMRSQAIAGALQHTGGKPWIYVDMNKALGAMGVGSLPSTVNPSQFLGYLKAAGDTATRVGTLSIHGVQTTEYRTVVSLDRYAAMNNVSTSSVAPLERAMGTHSMQVQAWIDSQRRVRRIQVAFPECVAGSHLRFSMTMGIYDFGSQPQILPPARGSVYNLTPSLVTATRSLHLAC